MQPSSLKEQMTMPDKNFPMKITHYRFGKNSSRPVITHWHNEMEMLYILKGSAIAHCNEHTFHVNSGDLIVVNCQELHSMELVSDALEYQCIILDPHILNSRFIDLCDAKYITPVVENKLLFRNLVQDDPAITQCLEKMIEEYQAKAVGFELSIKSLLFELMVQLIRNHIHTILTDNQAIYRSNNIRTCNTVIQYIQAHYMEELKMDDLCQIVHLSKYHFCRMFKKTTGNTVTEYINIFRIQIAETLLLTTDMSISAVAAETGYHDASYFTKTFGKLKGMSPKKFREKL